MKNTTKMAIVGALACAMVAGCGQFVAYDSGAPAPVSGTLERSDVDVSDLDALNHYTWAGLVASFTERSPDGEDVWIDYVAWSKDDEALAELDRYLDVLAAVNPSDLADEDQRLAYWINAYNAGVVRGVLSDFEGDVDGFKVIDSGVFFDTPRYTFGGVVITLNQIEQGVMRGDMENAARASADEATKTQIATWFGELWVDGIDARFHAAVNCAAKGCPNMLAAEPYAWRAEGIDEQLDLATRAWLNSEAKGAGPAGISNLFEWYESDFVEDAGSVSAFIEKHREGGVAGVDLNTIITYDWTLNAPPR